MSVFLHYIENRPMVHEFLNSVKIQLSSWGVEFFYGTSLFDFVASGGRVDLYLNPCEASEHEKDFLRRSGIKTQMGLPLNRVQQMLLLEQFNVPVVPWEIATNFQTALEEWRVDECLLKRSRTTGGLGLRVIDKNYDGAVSPEDIVMKIIPEYRFVKLHFMYNTFIFAETLAAEGPGFFSTQLVRPFILDAKEVEFTPEDSLKSLCSQVSVDLYKQGAGYVVFDFMYYGGRLHATEINCDKAVFVSMSKRNASVNSFASAIYRMTKNRIIEV